MEGGREGREIGEGGEGGRAGRGLLQDERIGKCQHVRYKLEEDGQ